MFTRANDARTNTESLAGLPQFYRTGDAMTRGMQHDSLAALERRLASWRRVRPDDPDYGLLALKVIPELEAQIAAQGIEAQSATTEGRGPKDESAVASGDDAPEHLVNRRDNNGLG